MPRYFLEVAYKGSVYSGFQSQKNANSIQAEVEKALGILLNKSITLTCSSRTDAGVHALQNFFHFDLDVPFQKDKLYNINAILPKDILAKNIFSVNDDAHCRFDALSREYKYFIYNKKNPFLFEQAFYYPFKLEIDLLHQAASVIKEYKNFESFSKRKTQVKTFDCSIIKSEWSIENDCLVYNVIANRFLRGMVKGLVGTMLKVGRNIISINDLQKIIENKDCRNADFSPSSKGLFLVSVLYPKDVLNQE
jgi:tRNA pseudouridine38-40 synthase